MVENVRDGMLERKLFPKKKQDKRQREQRDEKVTRPNSLLETIK